MLTQARGMGTMGVEPAKDPRVCLPFPYRKLGPVEQRLNELPFFLCSDQPDNEFTVPALNQSDILSFGVNGQGPMIAYRWSLVSDGDALVSMKISEGPNDIPMSNAGILAATIFGDNLNPYPLPETIYVDDLRKIKMWFTDISGDENTFRPCIRCRQSTTQILDPDATIGRISLQDKLRVTYPYFYAPDNGGIVLDANATQDIPISISSDFDFFLKQISYQATSSSLLIDIIDANTGKSLINAPRDRHYPVNINLIAGTGTFPARFHHKTCYHAGLRIILRLTDTSGSENTVYITLAGVNVARRMWSRSGT